MLGGGTGTRQEQSVTPLTAARGGLLSQLFFCWAWPTLKLGHTLGGALTSAHLPELRDDERPERVTAALLAEWEREQAAARIKGRASALIYALWAFYGPVKATIFVSSFLMTVLNIAIPLLMQQLILVIETDGELWRGLASIAGIVLCVILSSIVQQHAWFATSTKAVHSWIGLTSLIYAKPALLTRGTLSRFSEGELINLVTVDCQAFLDVGQFIFFFAAMPWQALIASAILLYLLGWVFVVGLVVLAVNVVIVERLGDMIKSAQARKNKLSDERSIQLNESLQGVRTVKLYAWEGVVAQRVEAKRAQELSEIRKIAILRAVQNFLSFGVPTIVTVPVFYLYKVVNGSLPSSVIFTAVAIFEFLNMALIVLPNLLNELRRMYVSIGRIGRFLDLENTYAPSEPVVGASGRVRLRGGFSWGATASAAAADKSAGQTGRGAPARRAAPAQPAPAPAAAPVDGSALALADLDFEAAGGQLVVVCGRVGSGKTSLASAALGLLQQADGASVAVTGRTAYVPQQSFVMNDTVKNNILFGAAYDAAAYERVILACALDKDLAALPSGDETEIGERGITISGGQRQRIAIARAAYAEADLIVLDDPLSAMDPHVGKLVFDRCILGLLRGKTRVFCTNQLQFAPTADDIYYLDSGRVTERGSFGALLRKEGGAFASLYAHVSSTPNTAPPDADADGGAAPMDADVPRAPPADGAAPPSVARVPTTSVGTAAATADQRRADGKLVQVEKRSLGRVGLSTFVPLARAAHAALLGCGVALLILLMPISQYLVNILLSRWADAEAAGEANSERWLPFYVGSALVFAVIVFVRGLSCALFFTRASASLHTSMLRSVLAQPMRFFDTTPVGRVLNRFSSDMTAVDVMLPRLFDIWAFIIGSNSTTVLLSMIFAPPMVVINVALAVAFFKLYNYYAAVAVELQRIIAISISPLVASFSSFLIGLESIRAFNRVATFRAQFEARQLAFARAFTALVAIERFTMTFAVTIGVSIFLSALALALLFLARARFFVTPGSAGVTLAYAAIISFRLPAMFLMSVTLERLLAAAQRVMEYVDMPAEEGADAPLGAAGAAGASAGARKRGMGVGPADDGAPDAGRAGKLGAAVAVGAGATAVPLDWPKRGTLVLRDVRLRYAPDSPEVLAGISFSVEHGERVGVVGRTGAGKSSVLLAIFRMAPTTGLIEIGGLDVSSEATVVPRRVVRARLGMIPQDSYLFSGTIRSNLDVENVYSDEQLARVLRLAHLETMIAELEGGLNAEVKEKGDNFSAGQVQLLCLARVLLKEPTIVFMDEATASVDLKTDSLVQQTIRSALTDCTIVTIAHRLATIIDFDKIAVLDAGKIAQYGPPHELLQQPTGAFAALVNSTGAASAAELRARAAAAIADKGTGARARAPAES